jgi:hypothetical protein
MRNVLTAAVKVGVTLAVAALATWALNLGVDIGDGAKLLEEGLFVVGVAVVNAVINVLSTKFPFLAPVFSLGLAKEAPTYTA